jgi:hypothetical protein
MQITKIISTEITTPTTAGAASSISSATCVRLFNNTESVVTIGINTLVGAASTNYFAMPAGSVEFLTKLPTDVLWTSAAIKANQVGFTN